MLVIPGLSCCGCTPFGEYIHNGFEVGPKYRKPPAPVAADWIDASDKRLRRGPDDLSQWWKVFNDPVLDRLICSAYQQNLTLRQAGFRVLEARAQLGIAVGEIFPQTQAMTGSYERQAVSQRNPPTASRPARPSSTSASGITGSTSPGNWTFGAASAGPSNRTRPS